MAGTTADTIFRQQLLAMARPELNALRMENYTRPQRRLIDEERVRRARAQPNSPPANNTIQQEPQQQHHQHQTTTGSSAGASGSGQSKRKPKRRETPKIHYMFEKYHKKIEAQVQGILFSSVDREGDAEWETNIIGEFNCSNRRCKGRWHSGKIFTLIRKYNRADGQLGYNAQVYSQRCLDCDSLGVMNIDEKIYMERVVRRLKIWKGEPVEDLPDIYKKTDEHEEELCEGSIT
ncbi:hypothetical protein H072_6906 [Dactylellina haptotyla CBS 200.50]|uniref:3CxxC-type domain-containing protein n=1 Tax=Dactylellina haptotyla (strain CBS 200.50) TaxID=1284197 RepID=S8A8Z3_DACHA|nr:hypothetical protein H072_6906 [Dactylellina haptotyla CBS 200.50]